MGSPTLALAWQFWARHRRGLCVLLAYFTLAGAVGPFLGEEAAQMLAPLVVLIPTFFAVVYLLAIFAHGFDNVGVDAPESGFPRWMLTLPVPTWLLVGCPLLLGGGLLVLFWVAYSELVLRGWDMKMEPVWPGFLLAAVLAWVQALVWRPFSLPLLRLPVLAVVAGLLGSVSFVLVSQFEAPAWVVAVTFTALAACAYPVAVRGVARARRGEAPDQTRLIEWLRDRIDPWGRGGPALASGWQAQIWLERRQHGRQVFLGAILYAALVLACLGGARETLRQLIASGLFPGLASLAEVVPPPWLIFLALLILPAVQAIFLSADLGRLDLGARRGMSLRPVRISTFLASRPLTSLTIVRAKWHAAGRFVLVAWAANAAALAVYLFALGGHAELSERFPDTLQGRSSLELGAVYAAGLALCVALTWLALTQGMWAGLSGRLGMMASNLGAPIVAGFLLPPFLHHLSTHPDHARRLAEALPWLLPLGLGVKVSLAGWLGGRVCRQGLASPRFVVTVFLAWLGMGLALAGLLAWLLPPDVAGRMVLVGGCLLAVPLSRYVAAPLAAEWNRRDA